MITISIVSHGHGEMVSRLLSQLITLPEICKIIVTKNIPENINFKINDKITEIENDVRKGFGQNHNDAFQLCSSEYFCVLNPDISISNNPFSSLLNIFQDESVGVVAPLIVNKNNQLEDSARYFPTVKRLIRKLLLKDRGVYPIQVINNELCTPDWLAGMFLIFKSDTFKKLNGFDTSYFLYYEDVDICLRTWKLGKKVVLDTSMSVVHEAQRESQKNIKFMLWHLNSMLRFLIFNQDTKTHK